MTCGTQQLPPGATGLCRGALNRATEHRGDPKWLADAAATGRILVVEGDRSAVAVDGDRARLVLLDAATAPPGDRLFLGLDAAGTPYFAVAATVPALPGAAPASLRAVGHLLSDLDADLFTTAVALANWHAAARHDPLTGAPTVTEHGGWVRSTSDGRTLWPRTDPAMIVLLHDGVDGPAGRCLLAHKPEWPANRYSCVAGYLDPGESAEQAVAREVTEEVGITVTDIRYVTSQPWPFPRSLMLAYTALADPAVPVAVDGVEIERARWFARADFDTPAGPDLPFPASVAYQLIATWRGRG